MSELSGRWDIKDEIEQMCVEDVRKLAIGALIYMDVTGKNPTGNDVLEMMLRIKHSHEIDSCCLFFLEQIKMEYDRVKAERVLKN